VRDFALWKAASEQDEKVSAAWDAPFGRGRPGWHLECSAMALDLLRSRFGIETVDIHAGAVDLIFPHHENEIAQSEAVTGVPFARYWFHGEFLTVEGTKMSKRFGNITTARDLEEDGWKAGAIRLLMFQTHYRQQLDLTDDALAAAKKGSERLGEFARRMESGAAGQRGGAAEEVKSRSHGHPANTTSPHSVPRTPHSTMHLHVHTHFSFGIGASSPEALVAAAVERGFSSLACTDTNGVYGAVEFQQAAEEAGIRPILGAHLVANGQETLALATDEHGWAALCRAISAIHWRDDPILSAQLAIDRRGLILLSQDPIFLERVHRLTGPEDLYAELRPGKYRHRVLARARELGLPAVVTNGVIGAHPEDWNRHRLLRAIALNTTLSALPEREIWPREAWLRPTTDLMRLFPD